MYIGSNNIYIVVHTIKEIFSHTGRLFIIEVIKNGLILFFLRCNKTFLFEFHKIY